jgi:hypothetical protein
VFVLLSLLDLFSQRIWEDAVNCPLALEVRELAQSNAVLCWRCVTAEPVSQLTCDASNVTAAASDHILSLTHVANCCLVPASPAAAPCADAAVMQTVDLLCNQYSCSDKQLVYTCHHALSGKVLVRAIAVSMPRTPALKLAIKIASHAATLATTPGGLTTLMELMQLYWHNQQAAEELRDVVTMMCYSLQGQMSK